MEAETPSGWSRISMANIAVPRDERQEPTSEVPLYSLTIEKGVTPKSERYDRSFLVKSEDKKYKVVRSGDLVLNPGNLRWGAIAISREPHSVVVSPIYEVFRPSQLTTSEFLGVLACSPHMIWRYNRVAEGTLRERTAVKRDDFLAMDLCLPPLPEQKKIAEILGSVDEAIRATEAVIEQTRRVKEGLLQELLTKGIGHTKFKQTEIGEIPEAWEVKRLGELTSLISKGASPRWQGFEYQDEGMAFVTSQHVRDGEVDLDGIKFLPLEFNDKIKRTALKAGDILVNIVGASIGRAAIWAGQIDVANVNQAVAVVRLRPGTLMPALVLAQFLSERGQDYFGLSKVDSARPNVSLGNLNTFPVAVPPVNEQEGIGQRIAATADVLRVEGTKKAQLELVKAGLLQDLLTGKVRVKP